jgi:hypothetical protein
VQPNSVQPTGNTSDDQPRSRSDGAAGVFEMQSPQCAANGHPHEPTAHTVSIDALQDPAMVLDRNFRVKTANRAVYEHFKLTQAEVEGNVLFRYWQP